MKAAKWVQMGTVVDHPLDGTGGRLPSRLRKRTLTQQWMADPEMGLELHKRFKTITVREDELSVGTKMAAVYRKKKNRQIEYEQSSILVCNARVGHDTPVNDLTRCTCSLR